MPEKTVWTDTKASLIIPSSAEPAVSIADWLGLNDNQLDHVCGVEIHSHSAAFVVGTRTIPAYEPYYRQCRGSHLRKAEIQASAASAITGVEAEIEYDALI